MKSSLKAVLQREGVRGTPEDQLLYEHERRMAYLSAIIVNPVIVWIIFESFLDCSYSARDIGLCKAGDLNWHLEIRWFRCRMQITFRSRLRRN